MGERIRKLGLGAVLSAALAIGWSPSAASGAINVGSDSGAQLASFDTIKCKLKGRGAGKRFTAHAKDAGWQLRVNVGPPFTGFRDYELEYGTEGPASFFFGRPGSFFSNIFDPSPGPPGPDLTVGGGLGFRKKGSVLGIGFPVAYNGEQPTGWVSVVGNAHCKY